MIYNTPEVISAINKALETHKLQIVESDDDTFRLAEIVEPIYYEYEMLFKSEPSDSVKIDGWMSIQTSQIRNPEKIDDYLQRGILRKILR